MRYRMRRLSVSAKQQYAEVTALRKPIFRLDARLAAVYRECEDAVLHRLDLAMQAFFRRCKRGETPGFPRFRGCFPLEADCVSARRSRAAIRRRPGVG
jgi:hypothetical protein